MIKNKLKSGVFFVLIMYGVFNVGLFTFINVVGCSCFNFKLWSFFRCRNLINLIQLLTATWCNKPLYIITNKDLDKNMLILRMSFCKLRFSRYLFCSSVSITKRATFLFRLNVPFRIDSNSSNFVIFILFRAYDFTIKSITRSLIILRNRERWLMIYSITIYSSARSSEHHQSVSLTSQ